LSQVTIQLASGTTSARPYSVRLHFSDPTDTMRGERRFHVNLQENRVLDDFDVAGEAGRPNRGVVREFAGIQVTDKLILTFSNSSPSQGLPPILSGIEIQAEGW
jgi:hypothetical protein